MSVKRYTQYIGKHMILRDHLAADRTTLANERTLLAYLRTGLTTLVVGISVIKLFDTVGSQMIGWLFVLCSIVIFLAGLYRFMKQDNVIRQIKQNVEMDEESALSDKKTIGLADSPVAPSVASS